MKVWLTLSRTPPRIEVTLVRFRTGLYEHVQDIAGSGDDGLKRRDGRARRLLAEFDAGHREWDDFAAELRLLTQQVPEVPARS